MLSLQSPSRSQKTCDSQEAFNNNSKVAKGLINNGRRRYFNILSGDFDQQRKKGTHNFSVKNINENVS